MPYFHFTSRKTAQDILCGIPGLINPGPSRLIFLTPTHYTVGHVAAGDLAIQKEVEIGVMIPEDLVNNPSAPIHAQTIKNPSGAIVRRGGGLEVTTNQPIDINGLNWFSLDQP